MGSTATLVESARQVAFEQARVDSLLRRGIVFSIIWIFGFGSIFSVICAFRAWWMIRNSEGALYGMPRVIWCWAVGGFGVLLVGTVVVATLFNEVTGH